MQCREQALETMHDVQQILKLLVNLVGGENEDTHYFLQLALKGVLEKVLQWNDPRNLMAEATTCYYALEIDVLLMKIFFNLVNSGEVFDYGEQLASQQDFWILERFASLLSNAKLDVRREALTFFTSLMRQLKGHAKDTVLERLDLIRSALYMLTHDSSTIAIVLTLALLESCFYYEAENLQRKLRRWEKNGEEVGTNPDWAL